ncbi:MAG: NAD(P)/FAD-dependent oxidoreductase [Chloroflexi bacterium]|jgi:predicted flavoprotein YhiN|nr:NAD(P)/FAD-dependent oxidoreductase [Chloroflexota bacterium]
MLKENIIVIGAGASGLMAAGRAAELGSDVLLLEKMSHPGKKILISGKTRCNLTNTRDLPDFISMFGPNGRFLYSAFNRYFRDDLLSFLECYGVQTKTERGGRVFPLSDDASHVVNAFIEYLKKHKVQIKHSIRVTGLQIEQGKVTGVHTEHRTYPAGAVILATGGSSFPATGSTGDGYRIAETAGHTIIGLRPGLVPLIVHEVERAQSMQGVSLRNVRLTAYRCRAEEIDSSRKPTGDCGRGTGNERPRKPLIESRMGEMMMTHFGIGGPITLQMSLSIVDALQKGAVSVSIDLKPALTWEQLDTRLQRDLDQYGKRGFKGIMAGLLPRKMVEPFIKMTAIPPDKLGNQIDAEERKRVTSLLKSLCFNIKCPLPLTSAMVTAGGVSLKEIDPRTMASRLIEGLYFCGEVIDLDADTGGYNLQAAFSTGYVAGAQAAAFINPGML